MSRSAKKLTLPAAPACAPASDVKKVGWRGMLERARRNAGVVQVMNHARPEGWILTDEAYQGLLSQAGQGAAQGEQALQALRARFDERLASLQTPQAGDRLRAAMASGVKLQGKLKAGASH